ncbi:MAG: FecR domain-containing protein [Myxococcota bacterium]
MNPACRAARRWLVERDAESAPVHLAHLASCRACASLSDRYARMARPGDVAEVEPLGEDLFVQRTRAGTDYDRFVNRVAEALEVEGSQNAEDRFVAAASKGARRPWRRAWMVGLVAAAAIAGWLGLDGLQAPDRIEVTAWQVPTTVIDSSREPGRLEGPGALRVDVPPGSRVDVVEWGPREVVLRLTEGSVEVALDRHPRFVVETPNARVIVVGTRFRVDWEPSLGTVVGVMEGTVRVEDLAGALVARVTAGETLAVPVTPKSSVPQASARGEVPARPKRSLPPPPTIAPQTVEKTDSTRVSELLANGEIDGALQQLGGPTDAPWQQAMLRADALQLAGRVEEAERAYLDALSAGAPAEIALVDLARLQAGPLEAGDRAERTWRTYLTVFPQGRAATEARLAITARGPDDVEELLRVVLSEGPGPAYETALARLTAHLLGEARWDDARELVERHRDDLGVTGEIAVVAQLRIAIARSDLFEAKRLVRLYDERFPAGSRRAEVRYLSDALHPRNRRRSGTRRDARQP